MIPIHRFLSQDADVNGGCFFLKFHVAVVAISLAACIFKRHSLNDPQKLSVCAASLHNNCQFCVLLKGAVSSKASLRSQDRVDDIWGAGYTIPDRDGLLGDSL